MIEKQSKQIRHFYLAYKKWLDIGAPQFTRELPFSRDVGLCSNISYFSHYYEGEHAFVKVDAIRELDLQFKAYGLDRTYPFHFDNQLEFYREVSQKICHLNPDRIEWVTMMCGVPDV